MKKFSEALMVLVLGILFVAIITIALAFPVKWCWNASMPYIFGLPVIGFWHAFSLLLLAQLLVKSSSASSKKED